jgi:hypothetical protein
MSALRPFRRRSLPRALKRFPSGPWGTERSAKGAT